ncbi:YqcC family protein [Agarivorans sp. MS3-6]|uniref:YqcC family protein n=1 Tax=Agarivorans sp. TSD2052 TaxID=2937286 RepID=UPI00201073EF|nr:YqcC family protein [Agarivorans sp. TSD2052]UPW17160.1 YqcC family protein [Agarivorans sp. TSD2052]
MSKPILQLLDELEQCLRNNAVWQSAPLAPEALESTLPFSVGSLSLPQWLQFIFLPRIRILITEGKPLPQTLEISPYAEEALRDADFDTQPLLAILTALDESFTND